MKEGNGGIRSNLKCIEYDAEENVDGGRLGRTLT